MHDRRCTLRVKSDSVSALTLLVKFKSSGSACQALAREVALDFATAAFMPIVAVHIPGLANVIADVLSRKFQPKREFALPSCLNDVKEFIAPVRTRDFFKTLATAPAAPQQ